MLPLHAEEGNQREVLSETDLVKTLIGQGTPEETSRAVVWILRRQFEALAILEPVALNEGNWRFVSFSASLLGHSWLTTLATAGQHLLPAGYWRQDAPDCDKEEQRALLQRIETGRVGLNPLARPIRVVHVAWAWIRIGDKFLMHRRTDKPRPGEKSYTLPGGRFNLCDLPPEVQSRADILREVYRADSSVVAEHIKATLERELLPETGLTAGKHYTFEAYGEPLPPYKAVNGPGNRYAYTVYTIHPHWVKLNHWGETRLLSHISTNSNNLKWFTAAEIAAPQRSDGASAYVDALHQAWGKELSDHLEKVPDSGASPLMFAGESKMLDLPGAPKAPFQCGKPGKEKAIHAALEEADWQLLMLLGWHARGYDVVMSPDSDVRLLGISWIEAASIMQLAHSLQRKTEPVLPGLVEIREDLYVSLRISPDILFLPVGLFRYQIRGNKEVGGQLQVRRCALDTPWGRLTDDIYEKDISGNTLAALRDLEKGEEPSGDWERTLRDQFGEGLRRIGLRRLWSTRGNQPCLVQGLRRISDNAPDD